MHFDFFVSDDYVVSYDIHRETIFLEGPPEIHCHSLNFQYSAMTIEEKIVQMLHYYMQIE